ncbi:MAG: DegT/DnrJ/EryC1/StrS family aminotransferase [Bacteroidetes bacterium]|nr:DegT/DnrJ/EryC1/StrS family aminotransferase [Bacteroidota bacterium]
MINYKILTAGPSITQKEKSYVNDAVTNGWNENWNSYILKLENAFREKFNVKHALLTSSCTGALHMSLRALGVGVDDEVIVPELTWVASASVVNYLRAKPIFVDVDKRTWTMNPKSFEQAITGKTKAVIPVHLYGHPSKMDEIMAIAHKHNIKVLEDAAPAIGATVNGKYAGTFGDVSAFSFQGAKMLVTGEGGIIITNDDDVFANIKQYSEHGRSKDPDNTFWIETIGYKYKMSNIQAALGLAQFERIDELIDKKRLVFSWYEERLGNLPGIALNQEASWAKSIYWMSSILLEDNFKLDRDGLMRALKSDGIDTRPVFPTISKYPMWKSDCINPAAIEISSRSINLPSGHNLTEADIEYVSDSIIKNLGI